MNRIAAASMIALAASSLPAAMPSSARADDSGALRLYRPAPLPTPTPSMPTTSRSTRVMSLLLALEALRETPDLLEPSTADRPRAIGL